jgi:hypothetical protein
MALDLQVKCQMFYVTLRNELFRYSLLLVSIFLTLGQPVFAEARGLQCRQLFQPVQLSRETIALLQNTPNSLRGSGIQILHEASFTNRSEINSDGGSGASFYKATYRGRNVWIKRPSPYDVIQEAIFAKALNELHLGPKFYGAIKNGDHIELVYEIVTGENSKHLNPGTEISESFHREMLEQLKTLQRHGIVPVDIQFMISFNPRRAVLIDPGEYLYNPTRAQDFDIEYHLMISRGWRSR